MGNNLSERRLKYLDHFYFCFWLVCLIALQQRHVPWRDEFQPWLIVVNTQSVSEFFNAIWYERQAPLQYILLWIVHKTFGVFCSPTFCVRFTSDIFAIGATSLIVYGLGLPRALRYLIPFSIFYFREYGVIARNYPMGVFFLCMAVLQYRRSKIGSTSIFLMLAGVTHLFFTWMATVIAWIIFWERRKDWRAVLPRLAPVALVSLAVVIFLRPPPDSPFSANISVWSLESLLEVFKTLARVFTGFGRFYGIDFQFQNWMLLPVALLLWLFFGAARRGGVSQWRFWLLISFPLFVSATTYNPDTRHAGTMFTGLIIAWLLAPREKPYLLLLTSILSVIATGVWLYAWRPDLNPARMNHSGAYDFLQKYGEDLRESRSVLLTDMDKYFFSAMGIANFDIFDIRRNRVVKYPMYKNSEYKYDWAQWCEQFGQQFANEHHDKNLLIAVSKGTRPSPECTCLELDFETPNPAITDEVSVYRWTRFDKNCQSH